MHVMVFTPVGPRLEPWTVAALFKLEWDMDLGISWLLQRDNPHPIGRVNVLHQYQRGREAFLRGPYEAMMVVESDIVPPPNALRRLAALGADVAYGVYRFRGTTIDNVANGEDGYGLGCCLIRRHVLERIDFRHRAGGHCDIYFNRDVREAGFSQAVAEDVVCGHVDKDGVVYWPKAEG